MTVNIKYGRGVVPVTIPDDYTVDVIHPRYENGLEDTDEALRAAIEHPTGRPLSSLLETCTHPGIVFSDATRATPNKAILPVLLDAIAAAGIADSRVTLFNATGTHRSNTPQELEELLGEEIVGRFRIVQNVCTDKDAFSRVGRTSSGNEICLNTELLACDLRILTGYIEPHFFAGYSGGGKAIMPGCASLDTIRRNHGAANIDHPGATWGELDDNPIAREVREAARMAGTSFLVNVTLNRDREITGVFAGELEPAHRRGCAFVAERAIQQVDHLYDLVITSNAGYPLDRNLYQSVKGMSGAARIVKPGGAILLLAACTDGVPQESNYARMLASEPDTARLLIAIRDGSIHDQDVWQVQVQARVAERAQLFLYSEGLTELQIKASHCIPAPVPDRAIASILRSAGPHATVCILPEGPETVPVYDNSVEAAENAPSR